MPPVNDGVYRPQGNRGGDDYASAADNEVPQLEPGHGEHPAGAAHSTQTDVPPEAADSAAGADSAAAGQQQEDGALSGGEHPWLSGNGADDSLAMPIDSLRAAGGLRQLNAGLLSGNDFATAGGVFNTLGATDGVRGSHFDQAASGVATLGSIAALDAALDGDDDWGALDTGLDLAQHLTDSAPTSALGTAGTVVGGISALSNLDTAFEAGQYGAALEGLSVAAGAAGMALSNAALSSAAASMASFVPYAGLFASVAAGDAMGAAISVVTMINPVAGVVLAVACSALGGLFGDEKPPPPPPAPEGAATIDFAGSEFATVDFEVNATGSDGFLLALGGSIARNLNAAIEETGAQLANGAEQAPIEIHYDLQGIYWNGHCYGLDQAQQLIGDVVLARIDGLVLEGGDLYAKRALLNSHADSLPELLQDLQAGALYGDYQANAEVCDAVLSGQVDPDTVGMAPATVEQMREAIVRVEANDLAAPAAGENGSRLQYLMDAQGVDLSGAALEDFAIGYDGTRDAVILEAGGERLVVEDWRHYDPDVTRLVLDDGTVINLNALITRFGITDLSGMVDLGAAMASQSGLDDAVVGTERDDILVGGEGATTLLGGSGADTLRGGGGDDSLVGGTGADVLDGGAGLDTVDYHESNADLTVDLGAGTGVGGEAAGDRYTGIEHARSGAGDDHLRGSESDNALSSGAGSDTLYGAGGDDRLDGGQGADRLAGAAGDDAISGGAGADVAIGSSGDDYVIGEGGNDQLAGGSGDDQLLGGAGDDLLAMDQGDDTLIGGGGEDTVIFDGRLDDYQLERVGDSLYVHSTDGEGLDRLVGVEHLQFVDQSIDLVQASESSAEPFLRDTAAGKRRYWDSADRSALTEALTDSDEERRLFRLTGRPATGTTALGDAAAIGIAATLVAPDIFASTPEASFGDMTDQSDAQAIPSVIAGVEHSNSSDRWIAPGDVGPDVVRASGIGANGGSLSDAVVGQHPTDRDDSGFTPSVASPVPLSGQIMTPAPVTAAATAEADAAEATPPESDQGGSEADQAAAETHQIESMRPDIVTIFGTSQADHLAGDAWSARYFGFAGDDVITGGRGNDLLIGGRGDDLLRPGAGSDFVLGDSGDDRVSYADLHEGVEINLQTGVGGADRQDHYHDIEAATGSQGDDTIRGFRDRANDLAGADGADDIIGGKADDRLDGGLGHDLLSPGQGSDRVLGGGGYDRVSYANLGAGVTIDLEAATGGSTGGDRYYEIEAATGSQGADIIYGFQARSNDLAGVAGDDHIEGGNESDTLRGGRGADALMGGQGNDELYGGEGNDRLTGGGGVDRFHGGAGADHFQIDGLDSQVWGGAGDDRVTAAAGSVLTGSTAFIDIEHIIGSDNVDTIILAGNGDAAEVDGGAGADRIIGGSGNDELRGGSGLDHLSGGGGDDILHVSAFDLRALGSAAAQGGLGIDTLHMQELDGSATIQDPVLVDLSASGIECVLGADSIDEIVRAGAGHNRIDAGGGTDAVSYVAAPDGVAVSLGMAVTATGWASGDRFLNVERLIGSNHDDWLYGSAGDDYLKGGDGSDEIYGGAGYDFVRMDGSHSDYAIDFTPGSRAATLIGGVGTDRLEGVEAIQFDDYTLYLDGTNNRPVLKDPSNDSVATRAMMEDEALTSSTQDMLALFMDYEGDELSIESVGDRYGVDAEVVGSQVVLSPQSDWNGQAIHHFSVVDEHGASSSTAGLLPVDVQPVNDEPFSTGVFSDGGYHYGHDWKGHHRVRDYKIRIDGNWNVFDPEDEYELDYRVVSESGEVDTATITDDGRFHIQQHSNDGGKRHVEVMFKAVDHDGGSIYMRVDFEAKGGGRKGDGRMDIDIIGGGGNKKPLALDLDSDGLEFQNIDDSDILADINGDGVLDRMAWIGADDALLTIDRDGDGRVSGFDEISFVDDHPDAHTDLEGIRLAFDSNDDGVLDANDARWVLPTEALGEPIGPYQIL